jgi:uncharacterized pyridoxal phosphate-containing UPF0001 family protein
LTLVRYIQNKCPSLEFCGLMTIGAMKHHQQATSGNPDFEQLVLCRNEIASALNIDRNYLELSMGMSSDFEEAVS